MINQIYLSKLNTISEDIRMCELHSMDCTVPVSYGALEWRKHGERFRIMFEDRPLIEQPIVKRIEGYKDIHNLYDLIADQIAAAAAARVNFGFDSFFGRQAK